MSSSNDLYPVYHTNQSYPVEAEEYAACSSAPSYSDKQLPQQQRRRTCGMAARSIVFLVIGLTIALAIAIGLGVGLGVGLPQANKSISQAASSSPSASSIFSNGTSQTATTSAQPSATSYVASWCPGSDGQNKTSGSGIVYRIACNSDISAQDKNNLATTVLPTFAQCFQMCDSMNHWQKRLDVSAIYNTQGSAGGTCWCVGNSSISDGATAKANDDSESAIVIGLASGS